MARKKRTPGYLLHKQSGQARVIIDGKDHLLGEYGSKESRAEYERLIALWQADQSGTIKRSTITIGHLIVGYLTYADGYYRKNGKVTSEVSAIRSAMRVLKNECATLPAANFTPTSLKGVREAMVKKGWKRKSINSQVNRIRRMLAWAVESELLEPTVLHACREVKSLAAGRTGAVEGERVLPAPIEDVEAIRNFVPRQVWAMICLQLETGMRPQEVRTLRLENVDRNEGCWLYQPESHKTEHHGRQRRVFLNQHAQRILKPFLRADPETYLFSPYEAWQESLSSRNDAVKIRKPRSNSCYSKDSYTRCIARACASAGVDSWSPNQLRHSAATSLEQEFGEDITRAILGHTSKSTTEIYVEKDFESARRAMELRKASGL